MIVLLDNIRSLYNVGSIFRTADGLGIEKIYLCGITPSPFDDFGKKRPQLAKVSLGAEDFVNFEYKESTIRTINRLKAKGYRVLALEQNEKSKLINEIKFTKKELKKTVLILGTEVTGIDSKILSLADQIIEIPMKGKKESFNVSVAFGIAGYSLLS